MAMTNQNIKALFQRKGYEWFQTQDFSKKNTYRIKRGPVHINGGTNGDNSTWCRAAHLVLRKGSEDIDVIGEANENIVQTLNDKFFTENRSETFIYQPTRDSDRYQKYRIYKDGAESHIEKVGDPDSLENLVPTLVDIQAGNNGVAVDNASINAFVHDDELSKRYVYSLLAKPFVILTGNSGTGKTRIAVRLANYFKCFVPVFNKDLQGLFQYILNNDIDIDGIRLASVSESSIEVFNTKDKKICISFGIIQEYVNWYNENGLEAIPERTAMQNDGSYDGQSYSWDRPQIQTIAKYVCKYQKGLLSDICEENCLLVPVGADWTDNTKILGYYNPLANKGKGKYEKTNVFEFVELAAANPTIPFFLILDEMNLSHVERYFSDFLSKMELLDYECDEKTFFDIVGYGKLELPKNLFITGTVNIDETTYMFSPKVLDRANVIEFKPAKESVISSFKNSSGDENLDTAVGDANAFLQLAMDVRNKAPSEEESSVIDGIASILENFYNELERFGFEFAYRTVKEIRLYAIAAYETAEGSKPDAKGVADIQILQKILPKIHGNKKQIGELLKNLAELCGNDLPRSKAKIEQMQERLNRFQYASFI